MAAGRGFALWLAACSVGKVCCGEQLVVLWKRSIMSSSLFCGKRSAAGSRLPFCEMYLVGSSSGI